MIYLKSLLILFALFLMALSLFLLFCYILQLFFGFPKISTIFAVRRKDKEILD